MIGVPAEPGRTSIDPWESQHLRREAMDLRTYGRDGPRAGYYGATRRSVGRTAAAYFFTLTALVIGGILIFLLFRILSEDGDDPPPQTPVPVAAQARIEAPTPGQQVPISEDLAVIASVVSGEDVVRFELLITGIITDQVFTSRVTDENTYAAVLTARFEAAGVYNLVVRAYTATGAEIRSDPVQVQVIPAPEPTAEPMTTAVVVADTEVRTSPYEEGNQAGTLEPDQVVTVIGATADQQWLLLENQLWIRLSAVTIDPQDLSALEVVEPPPPPTPTPTPPPRDPENPDETSTATASPATEDLSNAPDFIPTNAVLLDRGSTLRITITNTSTNPFSGAVVVGVAEVPADPAEQVVNVSIEPNGTTAINFTLDPPVTEQVSVTVIVDPDDAIVESSEDNNTVEFIVVPPFEGAVLSLSATVTGDVLSVTIRNDGDPLSTNDARLVVSVPGQTTTRTISPLTIAEGDSTTVSGIALPQTGEVIRLTLFIDGVNEATTTVPNPNVVDIPPDSPPPDTGEPPVDEGPAEPDLGDES